MIVDIRPIPRCELIDVFGLLVVLKQRGGGDKSYKIARECPSDFDLFGVVKAAALLGFVSTQAGQVIIEPPGEELLRSDANRRKRLVREQLERNALFACLVRYLSKEKTRSCRKLTVLKHLECLLPNEEPGRLFSTIVAWGRFGQLFGYKQR